jgi:hypothetical protein
MIKNLIIIVLLATLIGCASKPSEAELARDRIQNATKENAIYFLEHKDRVLLLEQEIKRLERESESAEQQRSLAEARNELTDIYPEFKMGVDMNGNAKLMSTNAISARIRLMEQEAEAYLAGKYD